MLINKNIPKSILAGVLIGIGATAYTLIDNQIIGAALFSIGLLSVFHLQANLFTGKVGGLSKSNWKPLLIMLFFNLIGIAFVALLMRINHINIKAIEKCTQFAANKTGKTYLRALIDAILCGVLIQLAVELKNNGPLTTIFCVMVFILCGFEHCIANAYYFIGAETQEWGYLIYLFLYIIGNSVGAIILTKLIQRSKYENN